MRRRLMMRKESGETPILPSAYQRVEYIENQGSAYIVTNYVPSTKTGLSVEFSYYPLDFTGTEKMVFGCNSSGNNPPRVFFDVYTSGTLYTATGVHRVWGARPSGAGTQQKNVVLMNSSELVFNGERFGAGSYYSAEGAYATMGIFCYHTAAGNATNTFKQCRIYYLTFYADGVPEADFIPCYRKSDGEIGMYDTVSQTFYTNAGTGTFTKGADV